AARVVDTDGDFYTLTYRPGDLKANNKWHKVKIAVDGPFHLSYRRGYFDDGTGISRPPRKTRIALRAHGESVQGPDRHTEPIILRRASSHRSRRNLQIRLNPVRRPTPQNGTK